MSVKANIKFTGINGGATGAYAGYIELLSYTFGTSPPTSLIPQIRGGRLKSPRGDFYCTKAHDSTSHRLYHLCISGNLIAEVNLAVISQNGQRYKSTLSDVLIVDIQPSYQNERTVEGISITFGSMEASFG